MKIWVKVKTNAKMNKVLPPPVKLIPQKEECYVVMTKAPPIDGKANEVIIKLLAKHFNVPRMNVMLVRGASSKQKVFEIKQTE